MISLLFLKVGLIAMNLPLSTAFTESQRFWLVVLSFSFVSMHIFISSVIYWFFRSVLFNFHIFVKSSVFLLLRTPSFRLLWLEKILGMISVYLTLLRPVCDLIYDLFWRRFSVCLRRMCILFCYIECNTSVLFVQKCGSSPMFPC